MKKKPAEVLRRLIFAPLVIGLLLTVAQTAFAQSGSTALTTQVPDELAVQVIIAGEGAVHIGGQVIQTSQTVYSPRNEEMEIFFAPAKGYRLKEACLNDTDITKEIYKGTYLLKGLHGDSVLKIVYEKVSVPSGNNPTTGDLYASTMTVWYGCAVMSLLGITAVLLHRKRYLRSNNE